MNQREVDDCFLYFDRDKNGFIDVDEFLIGIRGDLNDRRRALVRLAFNVLDKDKSGVVTVEDIVKAYDVSHNPDVRSGKITKAQALRDFMSQWDRNGDGTVTPEEFEEYYKNVSASIDGDDYFELMIRNSWHIAGGQGQYENTANKRVLVTRKDGTQAVVGVNDDLGVGSGDKDGYRARLGKQGEDVDMLELFGGMDTTEKAKRAGGRPPVGGMGGGNNRPRSAPRARKI